MSSEPAAPEYVVARRALLDVLELLAQQRTGLILVGAQAVYLRAPAEQAKRATYTTDADLAIDPDLLSDDPDIGKVMTDAGYERLANPGAFLAPTGVEIDLMVPEGAAGPSGRRSVTLPGQSRFTARRTAGLELALLDADTMQIGALDEADHRVIGLRVAGVAALTAAKLVKLEERLGGSRRDRIISKDAGDLLRLFRYCGADVIGRRLAKLTSLESAAPVIERATSFLRVDMAQASSNLVALAVEDRAVSETDRQVAEAMRELSRRLLVAFSEGE
jgi:hypothetical protein